MTVRKGCYKPQFLKDIQASSYSLLNTNDLVKLRNCIVYDTFKKAKSMEIIVVSLHASLLHKIYIEEIISMKFNRKII